MNRTAPIVLSGLLLAAVLGACSDDDSGDGGSGGSGGSDGDTTLTVFAASSLTNVFGELEKSFEADHDGVDVVLSLDSSSALATQITEGSPADVLATADEASMQIIVDAEDNAGDPQSFASNTMVIVTPPDNPAGIESVDDLPGTDYVLCDPSAPCGAVSEEILGNAGIAPEPVSLEDKVTAVLSKVTLGEADAGMVYVSDAQGAGDDVASVEIPDDINVATPYFIAPVADSEHADLAQEWIDLVLSQAGLDELAAAGFGPPAS